MPTTMSTLPSARSAKRCFPALLRAEPAEHVDAHGKRGKCVGCSVFRCCAPGRSSAPAPPPASPSITALNAARIATSVLP